MGTPVEQCRINNERLLTEAGDNAAYEKDLFDNLVYRYEEPNGMSRWDSPLFTVLPEDVTPPFDQIWDAFVVSDGKIKTAKPNAATVTVIFPVRPFINLRLLQTPASASDYLYELDNVTQSILSDLLIWQKDHPGGGGGEYTQDGATLVLPSYPISLPQLQRLRRQFTTLNRQRQIPKERIKASFFEYLSDNFSG